MGQGHACPLTPEQALATPLGLLRPAAAILQAQVWWGPDWGHVAQGWGIVWTNSRYQLLLSPMMALSSLPSLCPPSTLFHLPLPQKPLQWLNSNAWSQLISTCWGTPGLILLPVPVQRLSHWADTSSFHWPSSTF